jgi:hypothetical protein
MYKIEFITDWETIWSDDFQNQWLKWFEESEEPNIFFHPEFVKVWIETYLEIRDIKPIFCLAKDEQNNIVFLPLVLWSKDWKSAFEKVIVPVGYSDYDYHDPIVKGEIDFCIFWDSLLKNLKNKFSFNTFITDDIRQYFLSKNFKDINEEECPFVELNKFNDINSYIEFLSKSSRKEIRKNIRSLKELGVFDFKVLDKKESLDTLNILLEHHTKRYPNAYKAPKYHRNLINNLLEKKLLHFSVLTLDDKIISWRIGFIYNKIYYSYLPVFDNKFSKYSISKLHIIYVIEYLIDNKYKIYDLMRGAKSYKKTFSTNSRSIYSYNYSNNSLSTKIKEVALNVKSKIK